MPEKTRRRNVPAGAVPNAVIVVVPVTVTFWLPTVLRSVVAAEAIVANGC